MATNIKLGWKGLKWMNAPTYYNAVQIVALKRFATYAQKVGSINLCCFCFVQLSLISPVRFENFPAVSTLENDHVGNANQHKSQ
jgi:hypothetical protein